MTKKVTICLFLFLAGFGACQEYYDEVGTDGDIKSRYFEKELELSASPKSMIGKYIDISLDDSHLDFAYIYTEEHAVSRVPAFCFNLPYYEGFLEYHDFPQYRRSSNNEAEREAYLKLAEKHKDLSYDKRGTGYLPWDDVPVLAYDIDAVIITSSEDWDEEHPAGSALNDLFIARLSSLYNTISAGYRFDFPRQQFDKNMEELEVGDLWCMPFGNSTYFFFKDYKCPAVQVHEFTITFYTERGTVVMTESVDFSQPIPCF